MAKYKNYRAHIVGGAEIAKIRETCISKAVNRLIADLELGKEAKYQLINRQYARIRLSGNHTFMCDYVVMED